MKAIPHIPHIPRSCGPGTCGKRCWTWRCRTLEKNNAAHTGSMFLWSRYLRKKVLDLEVQNTRNAARSALQKVDNQGDPGVRRCCSNAYNLCARVCVCLCLCV